MVFMFKPINCKLVAFYVTANRFPLQLLYINNIKRLFHLPDGQSLPFILVHYDSFSTGSIETCLLKVICHRDHIYFLVAC